MIAGVFAYRQALGIFFLSDDFMLVRAVKAHGPLGAWSGHPWPFFRPLVSLSFFFDYTFWQLNPAGYHLTNILFHSLNAFLVFLCAALLPGKGQTRIAPGVLAFFSAGIFLLMPCHSEAVSWISGRCDVISASFFLAALYFYLRYRKDGARKYLAPSFLCYAAALFAKESAVIFPLIILLDEYLHKKENHPAHFSVYILPALYFLLTALYFTFRYLVLGDIVGGYGAGVHLNFDPSVLLDNLVLYTMRAFLFPYFFLKAAFFTIALGAAFFIFRNCRDQARVLIFPVAAFFISLLPVLNLGSWTGDTQSERFIYLPTAFSAAAFIFALGFLARRKKYFIFLALCLMFLCQISLSRANRNWLAAGEVCRNILVSLDGLKQAGRGCIVNLPDNLHGAYIYRNGIEEAAELFLKKPFLGGISVALWHNIYAQDDRVSVEKLSGRDQYRISLENKMNFFFPEGIFGKARSACLLEGPRIVNSLEGSYAVVTLREDYQPLFYSAGRLWGEGFPIDRH